MAKKELTLRELKVQAISERKEGRLVELPEKFFEKLHNLERMLLEILKESKNDQEKKNRFGFKAKTDIPSDVPLADNPGHKLRTSNVIVDRKELAKREQETLRNRPKSEELLENSSGRAELVEHDGEVGIIRRGSMWPDPIDSPSKGKNGEIPPTFESMEKAPNLFKRCTDNFFPLELNITSRMAT